MKGYLYILKTNGDHFYIGSTNNIHRRILEHKNGKTKSLKKLLPIELVFSKEYFKLIDARKAESKLKKFKNKSIIANIVEKQYLKF